MSEWTPEQITGAQAILAFERLAEPKCTGCEAGVLRPKCAYESSDCPRHESAAAFRAACTEIERLSGLKNVQGSRGWDDHWRYKMPLMLQIGPVEGNVLAALTDLIEEGGKKARRTEDNSMRPLHARQIVSISYQNGRYTYEITKRGWEYVAAMREAGFIPVGEEFPVE